MASQSDYSPTKHMMENKLAETIIQHTDHFSSETMKLALDAAEKYLDNQHKSNGAIATKATFAIGAVVAAFAGITPLLSQFFDGKGCNTYIPLFLGIMGSLSLAVAFGYFIKTSSPASNST